MKSKRTITVIMAIVFLLFLPLMVLEMLVKKQKGIIGRVKLGFRFIIPPQK